MELCIPVESPAWDSGIYTLLATIAGKIWIPFGTPGKDVSK